MSNEEQTSVPGRVEAALSFLRHCQWVETDDTARRDLSAGEQRVQTAALDVLRQYFLGEMDFGDSPPRTRGGEGESGTACGVPV